jgi:uncharacterized coiled-coil protein SlyX
VLKKKHPPMILAGHLKSKEKMIRAVNDVLKETWVELARLDRRLKELKKKVDTPE